MGVELGLKTLLRMAEALLAFLVILVHCGEIWAMNQKGVYLYFFTCFSASFVPLLARLSATLWKGYGFPPATDYTLTGISAIVAITAAGFSFFDLGDYEGVDPDDEDAPAIENNILCGTRTFIASLLMVSIMLDMALTAAFWGTGPPVSVEEEGKDKAQ